LNAEAEQLLRFWFGELSDGFSDDEHRRRWFSAETEFDQTCRVKFASLAARATDGELEDWLAEPRPRLGYILLCDQIPRNIYRGQALAFASDGQALNAARTGVDECMDQQLDFDERSFFYLPFEHSENLTDQHTCVGLFNALRDDTPEGFRHLTGAYLHHAHQHRDIVKRFGRFPHRNALLGREPTPEELNFLQDADDFSQSSR